MLARFNKISRIVLLVLAVFAVNSGMATAHVVVKDSTGEYGAVLHITPDDDPAAGEKAQLFFDIQKVKINQNILPIVNISNVNNTDEVLAKVDKNFVSAEYVFKSTGVYKIMLTITSDEGKKVVFEHSQRIARGEGGSDYEVRHEWAEIMMVVSAVTFLLLLVVILSRRKVILAKSK